MNNHKAVRSTVEISKSIVDILEETDPQTYNGVNRAQTIRAVNDTLQGRGERPLGDLVAELPRKCSYYEGEVAAIFQEIRDFQAQKKLQAEPRWKYSGKVYKFKMYDADPERPLKIINQALYDLAVKDGFPSDFFRSSHFDRVTFYCLPDETDLNFSEFHGCTFAVCRIRGARFDGARIYDSEFHSCEIRNTTFFHAIIANTHFHDSLLSLVSFQGARLKRCNTIDCHMGRVNFLNATLDGCNYGRITPGNIHNLYTATITQGGATAEECQRNRAAIFQALQVPDEPEPNRAPDVPPKHKRRAGPER